MKLISRGWQYAVYDLDNDRVKKTKYNNFLRYFRILFQLRTDFSLVKAFSELKRVDAAEGASNAHIQSIKHLLDFSIIGNPLFTGDAGYEQDKVRILGDVLAGCSVEEGQSLIDRYIQLILTTWEYGLADAVFNFIINNGINAGGNVVQVDFGELNLSRELVARDIETRRWLKSSSYRLFLRNDLKDYFAESMKKRLTKEELDRRWAMRLP